MIPVIVGVTGASGSILGLRTIEAMLKKGYPISLVCSQTARKIWQAEIRCSVEDSLSKLKGELNLFEIDDLGADIASGLTASSGMIVVPCSMGSLSAIACGSSDNLLERAADVTIKEGRRLILVPREMPLSAVHLQNMLTLSQMGVRIIPPLLTFYHHPQSIDDIINFVVERIVSGF